MRVTLLGNAGSGKSTLARWLCSVKGVAHLDLDTVAWEPGRDAVARPTQAAGDDVRAFCGAHGAWVVEGCYAALVRATLAFAPTLLFLNPGEARCLANCRSRPWERHKYSSPGAQREGLPCLLAWVTGYYTRDDEMSLLGHRSVFDGYAGPKHEITHAIDVDAPPRELAALLR